MGFIQKARELTDKLRPAPEVARYLATFGYLEYLKGIGHCNYIYRQQNEQERLQGLEEEWNEAGNNRSARNSRTSRPNAGRPDSPSF